MKKLFTFLFVFTFAQLSFGQGVFTSLAIGNWDAAASWTLSSGSDADGIPDADDDVSITTHNITIPASTTVECNNLTVNNAAQRVLMGGANSILNIYGTLNAAATPTIENIIDCSIDASAKIVFKRASDGALFGGNWTAIGTALRFEVNLPTGITGTASTNIKAREIIVSSGIFSLPGELRPDGGAANTGTLTISDGVLLRCLRLSRTSAAGTAFASFTINGTGRATFSSATAFPTTTSISFSPASTIEYTGATYAIVDRNYECNLICSGTGSKTWTLTASPRTIAGNVNVSGTTALSMGGGNIIISGNITVDEGAIIGCSNNSGTFTAASSGIQSFTLNGTARVTSNSSQAPNPTTGFNRQFAFDVYNFGTNSIVSFRNPSASVSVSLNIDQPTGTSFANVEFYDLQTTAFTTTFLLKQNVVVTGSIAFPRVTSGQPTVFDMGGFSLMVGKQIQNSLGTIGLNVGNSNSLGGTRTYIMSGMLELNGITIQNTLGGTDLPSAFYDLKLNNSVGVTVANAITVSNLLTLAGNNNYTNLSNITGYTGLEYAATVLQTTGSEFGGSITNLTINNSNGILLDADKTVNGILTLTSGNITTGSNTLTIGSAGTVSRTSGYIIGSLRKNSFTGSKTFEVGTVNGYTPVDLVATGTGDFTVSSIGNSHPNAAGSNVLQMYWILTNGGLTSADLTFNYLDADVVGNELLYELGRYSSGWAFPSPFTINTTTNTVSINGITTFSDWTLGEGGALPVELTTFTASVIGSKVKLNWQTATEINNYGFEVERESHTSTSLSVTEWEKVGFVEGNGNSNSTKNYSFEDNSITPGKYSYRLKQIDNDGTFEFSNAIEVDLGIPTEFSLSQNYPNPFNPMTKIQYSLPVDAQVTLQIYSITGELLESLVSSYQTSGSYTIDFNGNNYASGTYIYRLVANDFVQTKKMTLVK